MYDDVKWKLKLLNPRQEITQSTHAITLGQLPCILSFSVSVSFFLRVFFSHKKSQQSRASYCKVYTEKLNENKNPFISVEMRDGIVEINEHS